MVLQNRPTLSVPLILRSQVSVFSKVILALVPSSIVPIIPPPTIASDIESVPPSLSTISLFKVAAASAFFNTAERSAPSIV